MHWMFKILAVIFILFLLMFIAIIIEESFLGGKRRRRLEREVRAKIAAGELSGKQRPE